MSFRLVPVAQQPPFRVTVNATSADGAALGSLTLMCKPLSFQRFEEMASGANAEFLRAVVVDWSDVVDADGAALPFSPAALDVFCEDIAMTYAATNAYGRAISGVRTKN